MIDGGTELREPVMARAVGVGVGYAAAAALLVALLFQDDRVAPEHAVSWLVIAAAVLCADLIVVQLPVAGGSVRLAMSAIPVAVGGMFTDPRGLVAALLVASVVPALCRRQLDSLVVSVSSRLIAASMFEMLTWWLLATLTPLRTEGVAVAGLTAGGLTVVGLGLVSYELTELAGCLLAVRLIHGRRSRARGGSVALQGSLIMAYNALVGVLAVLIGLQDVWGLLLLAVPAAFLGLWYRSVQVVQRRYESMQRLYGFTAQLADLPDTEAIVTAALALCRQLLLCQHAHLVLQGAERSTRWEIPDGTDGTDGTGGVAAMQSRAAVLDPAAPPEPDVLGVDGAVLVPKGPGHAPTGRPYDDVMAAPVSLGTSEAGVLVVANHSVPGGTFDRDDLRVLEALSAHLGTALTSSRRLEQLQTAVAAREHEALHDGLTGMANRTLFSQWVSRELTRGEAQQVGVLVMNLDGFKDVNDSLGHQSGDHVLREIAGRLEALSTGEWFAARLGGDKFAVLLSSLQSVDDALAASATLAEAVARPIPIGDMPLEMGTSVGIAVAPMHGSDPDTLLQRAEVAMYSAKAAKRPSIYDPEMERDTRRRLTLGSSLRQALDSGRIEVWYQPVARSATGWTSGCEALLRWRDEDGFIPPSEFIPVAEHTGLIERLTWWTLENALRELRAWRAEDLCPSVAVNLSTRCLQAPDLISRIRDLLLRSDVPPSALTLEITESLLMSDPELAEDLLNQLGLMGVRVAIDDFGTGYSSLSRLKRLPVDTIKIDREFVINMHADRDDEAIVKATLEMAKNLGCAVVAEGVETFETWHRLQAFGCQQIQGYILAQPMPAHECRQWLRNRYNLVGRAVSDLV